MARPRGDDLVPVIGGVPVEMSCIFAIGPLVQRRPLLIGYAKNYDGRVADLQGGNWLDLGFLRKVYVVDLMLARRVTAHCHDLLDRADKRLRGDWFDVDSSWIASVFKVAANKAGVPLYTEKDVNRLLRPRSGVVAEKLIKEAGIMGFS